MRSGRDEIDNHRPAAIAEKAKALLKKIVHHRELFRCVAHIPIRRQNYQHIFHANQAKCQRDRSLVEEEMTVPLDYRCSLIGEQGAGLRQLMDEFQVSVSIPRRPGPSDVITSCVLGRRVDKFKEWLAGRVRELDKAKEERALRNYRAEMRADDPQYHGKLISQGGVE
ncbi:vigilin-like isoform X2 [Paramacrobiotus metropolitanus]|uniref:vigilin-like isoform X2 n=1 Tax=Paramacrobiotus metropolitanus TaxID=2943436 RepID=UPI002446160B|nr:vigilin-like isoform X2 [Paramacrobiotus metropolitanus]